MGLDSEGGTGAAIIGGSIISGLIGKSATDSASADAGEAAQLSIAENARQFDVNQANQAPFLRAGANALVGLQQGIGQSPSNLPQFQNQDQFQFNLQEDPGFQFARDQAINAVNTAQAGQGGFNSGNRLAALSDRITGLSAQFANDAFNRQLNQSNTNFGRDLTRFGLEQEREDQLFGRDQTRLNRLAALAGLGQTSASQLGQAGQTSAANIGNILTQNAATQGQLGIAGAQNTNAAIQGGISNALLAQQLNRPPTPMGFTDKQGLGVG